MVKRYLGMLVVLLLATAALAAEKDVSLAQHLQDISVTIRSGSSQGSGVIVTRELVVSDKDNSKRKVNFIWTAGHVVDNLRTTRTIIDAKGQERKIVDFRPAHLVKELSENGRKVGELKMDAKVVKYSDADNGEDLALLMVRKTNFVDASAQFYLEGDMLLPIGEQLYHVGSLLGQDGANSMTSGILSQVGRVLELGASNTAIFDQTTVAAFPGSSGGGIFLASSGPNQGKYIGMLTRGAGETFNLIVPVRRIHKWCSENDLLWAIDDKATLPTLEHVNNLPIEDVSEWFKNKSNEPTPAKPSLKTRIMD